MPLKFYVSLFNIYEYQHSANLISHPHFTWFSRWLYMCSYFILELDTLPVMLWDLFIHYVKHSEVYIPEQRKKSSFQDWSNSS